MAAQDEKEPAHQAKPPTNTEVTQIFNKLALAMGKHQRLLSGLSKHRPTTTTTTASPSPPAPGSFSSLTPTPTLTPAPSQNKDKDPENKRPRRNSLLDDLSTLPNSPNNGIGYAPSSTTAAATAQDKDTALLRRKVLGRNAARQLEERDRNREGSRDGKGAGGSRKRGGGGGGVEDSESEEEVGRGGALVRRRGVRGEDALAPRRKKARVESSGPGLVGGRRGQEVGGGGSVGPDGGEKTGEGDVVMGEVVGEVKEGTADGAPQGATLEQAAGEKKGKRKNKNKKKKKKGTDGAAEVEAESEAKGEGED